MINKKLAKQILEMVKQDQEIRKRYLRDPSLLRDLKKIDKVNVKKMKKVIRNFGWPPVSLVGKRASHCAWLIIQHADFNLPFQEYCLKLMKKVAKENNIYRRNIAYLTDRILVNKGKPQIYGTQFYKNSKGKLVPRPLVDLENLAERRKEMDLEPFSIYKKRLQQMCD